MKEVRVQYTVQDHYVEQNKTNIKAVMDDLREHPIEGMFYATWYLGEGRFMHLNVSRDAETAAQLGQRNSFNHFRSSLKASGPVVPPQSEPLEMVGTSADLI